MKKGVDGRVVCCGALVLALLAFILAVFSQLSVTDKTSLSLRDTETERFGWRYELLSGGETLPYEPVFGEDGLTLSLPEGTQAVRMTRTMAEEIPEAEIEWFLPANGVEVSLDGDLLYSDFAGAPRGGDGFLRPGEAEWASLNRRQGDVARHVRLSLPEDYLGKALSVTTYFPAGEKSPRLRYPFLGNEDALIAPFVVASVRSDAVMTVYAILTLLIAILFLLDLSNDGADARTLLLCLYFLCLFLTEAYFSTAGYYSGLSARVDMSFLYDTLSIAPLYFYLALRLKSRWKYPLCAAVAVWAVYEAVRRFLTIRQGRGAFAYSYGPATLAVLLAVVAASLIDGLRPGGRLRQSRRDAALYALTVAATTLFYVLGKARAWGGLGEYLTDGVLVALSMGNVEPVVTLFAEIASTVVLIVLVLEFVRRTLRNRQEIGVLQDRERQARESYERLLAAQEANGALRHEMRHHFTALASILSSGDVARASSYVTALAGDLEQLPVGRYSKNLLVNVIAASYLDRARAQWIQVEHRLNVPAKMQIADEDLSMFLSNMLQNALEACERLPAGANRYIRVDMELRGNFLFIRCVNSAPPEDGEDEARPDHGYGLAIMRKVAKKYDSVLVVKRAPGEFTVKSDLNLKA